MNIWFGNVEISMETLELGKLMVWACTKVRTDNLLQLKRKQKNLGLWKTNDKWDMPLPWHCHTALGQETESKSEARCAWWRNGRRWSPPALCHSVLKRQWNSKQPRISFALGVASINQLSVCMSETYMKMRSHIQLKQPEKEATKASSPCLDDIRCTHWIFDLTWNTNFSSLQSNSA